MVQHDGEVKEIPSFIGSPKEKYTWTFFRGVLSGGSLSSGLGRNQPGDPDMKVLVGNIVSDSRSEKKRSKKSQCFWKNILPGVTKGCSMEVYR